MKKFLQVLVLAAASLFASAAMAFAVPFETSTVESMYTQGSYIWDVLRFPVLLALGITFVVFVINWGYRRISAALGKRRG